MDTVILKIPKKSEYMSTVRLTTSALANIKAFNVDEIEDIKVIISEICTFFIRNIENDFEDIEIVYNISDNRVMVRVSDFNEGQISDSDVKSDMSVMIIESLSDTYNFNLKNKTITFEKNKIL